MKVYQIRYDASKITMIVENESEIFRRLSKRMPFF